MPWKDVVCLMSSWNAWELTKELKNSPPVINLKEFKDVLKGFRS